MGMDEATAAAVAVTAGALGAVGGYMLGGMRRGGQDVITEEKKLSAREKRKMKKASAEPAAGGDLISSGDAKEGAKLFKAKCASCHSVDKGGPTKQGPNLYAIMGKTAASSAGFKFTEKLKKTGIVWDNETMFQWMTNPKAMVKGTTMAFPGFKKETDRAHLVAYLHTLSPEPTPEPVAAAA